MVVRIKMKTFLWINGKRRDIGVDWHEKNEDKYMQNEDRKGRDQFVVQTSVLSDMSNKL